MKNFLKIAVLMLLSTPLSAQYFDQDALRLSLYSLQGNARYVGLGGAFGALGGNLSALSTNPAGIGIYRSSELSFTPALMVSQTRTKTDEKKVRLSEKWNFNMGNFGWVGVINLSSSDSKNEWKKIQFGIGMNRLADFGNLSKYTRYAERPYLEVLREEAALSPYGHEENDYTFMAWNLYLIDTLNGQYITDLAPGRGLTQFQTVVSGGSIHEWVFSLGGNYGDYLYLGATIGRPIANFNESRTLTEEAADEYHPDFYEWKLSENLDITGKGANLKLGMIVKPADFIRLGLALHTPTRYKITEKSSIEMRGSTAYADWANIEEVESTYDYYIRTPMRLIGSLGFVIAQKALIGLEYEHLNYNRMWIDDMENTYEADNDYIANNYKTGGTFKAGAEYRFDPMALRVGYNYVFNPYNESKMLSDNTTPADFSQQTFSAGVGFHLGSMTLDLTYANTIRKYNKIPYPTLNINEYDVSGHQFFVTLGFRF